MHGIAQKLVEARAGMHDHATPAEMCPKVGVLKPWTRLLHDRCYSVRAAVQHEST